MSSISVIRTLPNTPVTLTVDPAAALSGALSHGDASDHTANSKPSPAIVDQTRLSATGTSLAQALSGSDVRYEKVAALRQTITDGVYFVPSSAVAANLVKALQGFSF